MMKGNILIVEDEVAIAQDIRDLLEINGYGVVGIAYTYDQAMEKLASTKPNLVFIDIALQGRGTGLDVADVINRKYNLPFIFLTSFSDQETVNEVVKRNPGGYLIKPFKEKDIAPAVALVLANDKLNKKEVFPSIEMLNSNLIKGLSSQEYKVLKFLWQGNKNAEIGNYLSITTNTIKTHLTNIYNKLNVNSRTAAINKVMNM